MKVFRQRICDDRLVRINSCLVLAVSRDGTEITTVEGLGEEGSLHPLQAAFVEHDAFQCGYCTPGQLCSAAGLMSDGHAHTRAEIRETSPDLDKPHKDEKQTADAISRMMTEIADKTFADGRHAIRSVHAKSHGIFKGTFEILSGLPEELAQGFFAKPSTRPAVLRFSTIPGDLLDDSISTPRGLAMKIIGVEGARLEESEQDQNQDFLMVNGPTFNAPNANAFHKNLKLLAPTTDRIPEVKKGVSAIMRSVERRLRPSADNRRLPRPSEESHQPISWVRTFNSQLPLRYGDYIAKVQLAPVSDDLPSLTGRTVDIGWPDILRELVVEHFRQTTSVWEFRVQLCADLETMPIGDPTK